MADKINEDAAKTKRNRSPNFPVVSLKSALEYLEKLHKYANGQHLVPMLDAIEGAWGMKKGSAYGKQVVGALKSFGLIKNIGTGDGRKIKVSDSGAKIRGDHSDRVKLLKKAVLAPTVHGELWGEFSSDEGLPPAVTLRQYLLFDRKGNLFNGSSVDSFIAEFLESIEFANLVQGDEDGEEDTANNGNGSEAPPKKVQVGSFVQWISAGEDQFPVPKQVLGVEGEFAFVEGSQTGLPMSDLSVVDPPAENESQSQPPNNPFFKPPAEHGRGRENGSVIVQYKLDEGSVRLEWPDELSQDSVEEFEYWVQGLINRAKRKAGLQAAEPTMDDILS